MPVIENLKNFIKDRHHNHHHQQQHHQQQQQQQQQQQDQPQNIQYHHNQAKPGQGILIPPKDPQDHSSLTSNSKQAHMNPAKHQASTNEKQDRLNTIAPNQNVLSDVLVSQSSSPLRSPTAASIGGTALAAHGEKAEALIEKARIEKNRLPVYEGLPEHFILIEKMGDGAFSNVYKALDKRSSQKVAIKCVRKFELNRNQISKPSHTGCKIILMRRSSPGHRRHSQLCTPSPLDLDYVDGSYQNNLIFFIEGKHLNAELKKKPRAIEELARHVILQVARGIRYLHEEKGVVHRDIKPENLLFEAIPIVPSKQTKQRPYDEEKEDEGEFLPNVGGGGIGQVKIADFGLSKIVWADQTATPCGTVGYTAPEIVKDERYSKSVDMWAMGCVLYTLLCGFPPFFDESIQVLTEKVARGYYTFLSPWWDDISDSSKDLISHLLCVDPDKRYTIDEFLAHPWCKEKAPLPEMNTQEVATMAPHIMRAKQMNYAPIDSPLLHATGGGMRTPGVAQLREAFDVTYAVHRMEEEGARRARFGGAGNVGVLHGLNEEEEEEDEHLPNKAHGAHNSSAPSKSALKNQAWGGAGGADRHMAEAMLYSGQAGTRDRGHRHHQEHAGASGSKSGAPATGSGLRSQLHQSTPAAPQSATTTTAHHRHTGFELNIDQATLLGRRNKLTTPIE
ncbi:uncharacterized protein VP01_2468g5 [Puccinia sorghi]|uniref:Protein kinase domain-containing protein n=1 Tax=Puccinia sorghi TaxID=27349 RepID=A0A0L6V7W0_9BASI|nr:uncharacterized protein VP01_2468g5 [Puccinia sorghi]